jgi:hypothetical protein
MAPRVARMSSVSSSRPKRPLHEAYLRALRAHVHRGRAPGNRAAESESPAKATAKLGKSHASSRARCEMPRSQSATASQNARARRFLTDCTHGSRTWGELASVALSWTQSRRRGQRARGVLGLGRALTTRCRSRHVTRPEPCPSDGCDRGATILSRDANLPTTPLLPFEPGSKDCQRMWRRGMD